MSDRLIALIAGASGSGKSHLARLTGWPVLRLDDFYRDGTTPGLPRGANGQIDWDDVATWDGAAALAALQALSATGRATVPVYDIAANAAAGQRTIEAGDAPAIVAEGIFATHLLAACRAQGLPVIAIWLDRGRWPTWWRRLRRDIRQHRKPPAVLWRRGIALCRAEPALRQAGLAAGFTAMTMRQARHALRQAALTGKNR